MGNNVTGTDDYARRLLLSNVLREPAIASAIRALRLPAGSRGLDVGCGIGLHTPLLAQAVGRAGRVTGLDLSPDFLQLARERAGKLDLSAQLAFQTGDVTRLPFGDDTFDWVWSADTLYPGMFADPLAPAKELVRVVKPGGSVAILYWSSQKLLPGYSLLEARLDAAFAESAPYLREVEPELHFLRATGWLRDAGLTELTAQTFAADVHAPLSENARRALTMTFDMFWGGLRSKLSPDDWAAFERLCQPESPDFILNRQDYYAFLTYSLFQGKVASVS